MKGLMRRQSILLELSKLQSLACVGLLRPGWSCRTVWIFTECRRKQWLMWNLHWLKALCHLFTPFGVTMSTVAGGLDALSTKGCVMLFYKVNYDVNLPSNQSNMFTCCSVWGKAVSQELSSVDGFGQPWQSLSLWRYLVKVKCVMHIFHFPFPFTPTPCRCNIILCFLVLVFH